MAENNSDLTETLVFQNQTIIDLLQDIKSLLESSVQESQEMNSTLTSISFDTGGIGSDSNNISDIALAISSIEKELDTTNGGSFASTISYELNAIQAGVEILGFK